MDEMVLELDHVCSKKLWWGQSLQIGFGRENRENIKGINTDVKPKCDTWKIFAYEIE